MDLNITENLITEAFANVNLIIVLGLMAIGFIIKHTNFLDKVSNDIIPPTLLVLGLIAAFIQDGFTFAAAISGIVSAAVAIGLHQQGKNIFTVTVIPKIKDWLTAMFNKDIDDTAEEELTFDEEIDEEVSDEE